MPKQVNHVESGKKAAETTKAKNPNHFREMAYKAHAAYLAKPKEERPPRGFAAVSLEQRKAWGAKGGAKSKKGKSGGISETQAK